MSGNINKPLLKVLCLNLNSIYRHSYLVPSGSAGVHDPVVFHVGCGRTPVQQPHDHWRHLLQLRSRSGNTQLHTGTVVCFTVQINCLGGGLPNPPACRPPGCRPPSQRQTLPHADPLDAEPPSPRGRPSRLQTPWMQTPLPEADPPACRPPGCRTPPPPEADPPAGRPLDADPPGGRPPPGHVACDACWEANSPPP